MKNLNFFISHNKSMFKLLSEIHFAINVLSGARLLACCRHFFFFFFKNCAAFFSFCYIVLGICKLFLIVVCNVWMKCGYNVKKYCGWTKLFLEKTTLHVFCMIYNFTIARTFLVTDTTLTLQKTSEN